MVAISRLARVKHLALASETSLTRRILRTVSPIIRPMMGGMSRYDRPCLIVNKLPNGYQSVLVVVVVVAVMPIWLRKSAGRKEHKQDKY
jgi:hypothetical protein